MAVPADGHGRAETKDRLGTCHQPGAELVDDGHPRGRHAHRGGVARGGTDWRSLAAGRGVGRSALLARREARAGRTDAGAWQRERARWALRSSRALLQLHVPAISGDGVRVRPDHEHESSVQPTEAHVRYEPVRDEARVLQQQGRHACPDVHHAPTRPREEREQPDHAVRVRWVRGEHEARVPPGRHRLGGARRRVRGRQHPGRWRVWRGVAPCRPVREEAERVRRLHWRRRVSDPGEVHVTGEARDQRWLERRAPRGRRDDATTGVVRCGGAAGRRARHAPIRRVHGRRRLGHGVRRFERHGGVQISARLFAAA